MGTIGCAAAVSAVVSGLNVALYVVCLGSAGGLVD